MENPFQTILKVFLFLGLLLVSIGVAVIYTKYKDFYEGFQTTNASGQTQCQTGVVSKDDEAVVGPESDSMADFLDSYESYNLDDQPDTEPTPLEKYDMASMIADFDVGAKIPWDYDLLDQDPQQVLWGTVHPVVSQDIFSKAYLREVFSSANNFEFSQPDRGPSYQSPSFGCLEFTDPDMIRFIKVAEFGWQFAAEHAIEMVTGDNLANLPKLYRAGEKAFYSVTGQKDVWLTRKLDREAAKFSKEVQNEAFMRKYMGLTKDSAGKWVKADPPVQKLPWKQAKAEAKQLGDASKQFFRESVGRDISVVSKARDAARPLLTNILEKGAPVSSLTAKSGEIAAKFAAEAAEDAGKVAPKTSISKVAKSLITSAGDSLKGGLRKVAEKGLKITKFIPKQVNSAILKQVGKKAAEKIGAKLGGIASKILVGALAKIGSVMAILAGMGPPGWAADAVLAVFTITMIVIIPSIFTTFIPDDAVCPEGYPFNINDAVVGSSGSGGVGWDVITSIPLIGDALGAFGPYICSASDGSSKLKVPPKTPPYYYDSTLSLFFDMNKGGFRQGDPALSNPIQYYQRSVPSDMNSAPIDDPVIWIDFTEPIILNRMAKFYYNFSRKFPQTNYDGSLTFEYITKIYGLIGSSRYSCDIQCELEEVTYFPFSGKVKCRQKVPNPDPIVTGTRYHDRRFYFWIDWSKGMTKDARRSNKGNLALLYADNLDKYQVSGCTHVDGTGVDAIEISEEGGYVGDALVALGDPNTTNYYPPVLDVSGTIVNQLTSAGMSDADTLKTLHKKDPSVNPIATEFLQDDTCNVVRSRTMRFGKAASNPDADRASKEALDAQNRKFYTVIKKSATAENWGATTKIFNSRESESSWREKLGTFTQSAISSYIPLKYPVAGGLGVTLLNAFEMDSAIACTYQDTLNQSGTFIINGIVLSSEDRLLINRGPTVDYAPGFTVTYDSDKCSNIDITLSDCTNRYPLRRFLSYYATQYPTKRIKQINDISVRRKTATTPPMCVYSIRTATYDPATYSENPNLTDETIGVQQYQDRDDITCTYKPRPPPNFQTTTTIPEAQTIPTAPGTKDPILTSLPASNGTFRRGGCKATNPTQYTNCNDPVLQKHLMDQFNEKYDRNPQITNITAAATVVPEPVAEAQSSQRTIMTSASDSGNSTCPKQLLTVDMAKLALETGEYPICHFKVDYSLKTSELESMKDTRIVSMRLAPSRTKRYVREFTGLTTAPTQDDLDTCLWDLAYDNVKTVLTYPSVPKNGQWVDVPSPPVPKNPNFKRAGCTAADIGYTDCSGLALVSDLVNAFNIKYQDRKILKVIRATTPQPPAGSTDTFCDYEVEMMRTAASSGPLASSRLNQRETVRIYLTPKTGDTCKYSYSRDDSNRVNSGFSINLETSDLPFKTPLLWPVTFMDRSRRVINQAIANFKGFDIENILRTNSLQSLDITNKILKDTLASQYLGEKPNTCDGATAAAARSPAQNCRQPALLRSIVNRYNFYAYPEYPKEQYGYQQRRLIEVRRAGVASASKCQTLLIERIEYYKDYTKQYVNVTDITNPDIKYNPKFFERRYEFNVDRSDGNSCAEGTFTLSKAFSKNDISGATMDISANLATIGGTDLNMAAFALQSDTSILTKDVATAAVANTLFRQSGSVILNGIYTNELDAFDPTLMAAVKTFYDSTSQAPGCPNKNVLQSFIAAFNPRPNIIEYVVVADHWIYNRIFKTWATKAGDPKRDTTIIVVKWNENTKYTIDTAELLSKTPDSIDEFYSPEIKWVQNSNNIWVAMRNDIDITATLPYIYYSNVSAYLNDPLKQRGNFLPDPPTLTGTTAKTQVDTRIRLNRAVVDTLN